MSSKTKRIISLITAMSMSAVCLGSSSIFAVDDADTEYTNFPYTCECEELQLEDGMETWTSIYGEEIKGEYSGDGFVYLTNGTITMEINVPEDAMYEIDVKYAQILSEDGREQTISINGANFMYKFPYTDEWQNFSFGVHRLKAGKNIIQIKPQYGYACFDTITIKEAELPELDVAPVLSDAKATAETQGLMNYLSSVYGDKTISGQQEIYGGGNDGDMELEFEWINKLTGEYPAIRGFDFMNYNPLYGWDDQTTERAIEWTNERNGIATASWHINVPLDFDSYTIGDVIDWKECTYGINSTFDTANAIVEGTKENEYLMLAIEDLAEQLARLQEANVPIILRPFHEAEGNGGLNGEGAWFWWGKAGVETYKELWKLLYNTLTVDYDLHNIIWEENLYTWSPESAQWYVGDDYVDIIGYDKYNVVYNRNDGLSNCPNEDAISTIFYGLVDTVDNKKMVAMSENDTIPSIENMQIEKAGWLYFCPWYGEHLMSETYNYQDSLISIYQSDYTITLDELPEWKTFELDNPPIVTESTAESTTESIITSTEESAVPSETTTDEPDVTVVSESINTDVTTSSSIHSVEATLLGDVTCDGEVDVRDVTKFNQYNVKLITLDEQALANANVIADDIIDIKDLGQLKKFIIKVITEF